MESNLSSHPASRTHSRPRTSPSPTPISNDPHRPPHVRFRSRVRIASGMPRGHRDNHDGRYASDGSGHRARSPAPSSSSPSSSVSAPLRAHPAGPRGSYTQRLLHLARQKRRPQESDHDNGSVGTERTPLLGRTRRRTRTRARDEEQAIREEYDSSWFNFRVRVFQYNLHTNPDHPGS
jgi:hypothetical protein